jgi:hypothetical protein
MSQTIIDNINNYTMEIVNNSLILTPKGNIASHIIKIGRTIQCNDNKYIVKNISHCSIKSKPLCVDCYNKDDVKLFKTFYIPRNRIMDVELNNDEIIIIYNEEN